MACCGCACAKKKTIYGNAMIWTLGSEEVQVIENGAILVSCDVIEAVGTTAELKAKNPEACFVDLGGKIMIPGIICAHGHFYGLYSRGMNLFDEPPKNFVEILERLWWRLDRALDDETNMLSALLLSINGLKAGTTCILDHHASPTHIAGSLDKIAEGTLAAGCRAVLAYEVTDRNGEAGAKEGIAENVRFMKKVAAEKPAMLGASFGLHAPFTLCEKTLSESVAAVQQIRKEHPEFHAGFHVHVAEDKYDEDHSQATYGKRCLKRMAESGVLGPDTIVGHGVFLDESEIALLKETGTSLVTNPESNMNNAVGLPDVLGMMEKGVTVGLGTDGMTYDMFQEYKANILAHKLKTHDPRVATMETFKMLFRNNSIIASKFFPKPVGRLEAGCYADFVVLDHKYPTQISAGSLPWQVHFGLSAQDVAQVFVGGKEVVRAGKMLTIDEDKAVAQSRAATPRVWANFQGIVASDKAKKTK